MIRRRRTVKTNIDTHNECTPCDHQENSWIDTLIKIGRESLHAVTDNITRQVQGKIQNFITMLTQTFIASTLFIFGIVFMMVGFSVLINEYIIFSNAFGYLLVGFAILVIALIVGAHIKKDNK